MLTEKDYCDYKTCVALKELGFNSLVDWYFKEDKSIASSLARYRNTYIPKISLYEAQKWLREEKGMNVNIRAFIENGWYYTIQDCKGNPICSQLTLTEELYSIYKEALLEGLRQAIKILKGC